MHFPYLVKGRLLSLTHCPLLETDSPSTSHTCLLCYPLPHSLICWVPSGSTCRGTIKPYIPKKVCVKNYLLLQQSLLFVIPPTPSHSLLFPLAPSPARHCASLSLWSLISAMSLATSHFLLFLLSQDNPPHTSTSPAQPLAFSLFHYEGVFSHNITHFIHLILKYLLSPYSFMYHLSCSHQGPLK